MDFISLGIVVTDMASHIRMPPGWTIIGSAEFQATWPASEAAAKLFQHLHNETATRPQWVEEDSSIQLPLVNDAISGEGMNLLHHAAQWFKRETERELERIILCQKNGVPLSEQPLVLIQKEDQWGDLARFLRAHGIGFDKANLVRFLDACKISHRIDGVSRATGSSAQGEAVSVSNGDEPAPLSKREIGKAFAGVYGGWDEEAWCDALGDKRTKWFASARVELGERGKDSATWDPVVLALLLLRRQVTWDRLNEVFKHDALRAWRDRWVSESQESRPVGYRAGPHTLAEWMLK